MGCWRFLSTGWLCRRGVGVERQGFAKSTVAPLWFLEASNASPRARKMSGEFGDRDAALSRSDVAEDLAHRALNQLGDTFVPSGRSVVARVAC